MAEHSDSTMAPNKSTKHTIHDVLAQFREAAFSNHDLGDRFERLICRYLELDPIYAERFSGVWMWNEWPRKGNVGDVGIDVVAEERATGEFCAIQCKFYLPEHTTGSGHQAGDATGDSRNLGLGEMPIYS
jgi:predicted helicase